jgi:hypothetical protein
VRVRMVASFGSGPGWPFAACPGTRCLLSSATQGNVAGGDTEQTIRTIVPQAHFRYHRRRWNRPLFT